MGVLKDVVNGGVEAIGVFKPPSPGHDIPPRQHIWNWRIFFAVAALGSGFVAHLLLACGYIPSIYPGFASAGELQELATAQRQANLISLQDSIMSTNERWCKASGEARGLYWAHLTDLRSQYFVLAKRELPIPSCSEI